MSRRPVWLLWLLLSTVAIPAAAHPGHGTSDNGASATHYVTEPVHALALFAGVGIAAIAVLWTARLAVRQRRA